MDYSCYEKRFLIFFSNFQFIKIEKNDKTKLNIRKLKESKAIHMTSRGISLFSNFLWFIECKIWNFLHKILTVFRHYKLFANKILSWLWIESHGVFMSFTIDPLKPCFLFQNWPLRFRQSNAWWKNRWNETSHRTGEQIKRQL